MSTTTLIGVKFVVGSCATAGCDVPFVTTTDFDRERRNDHKTFYCPRGHSNYYPQRSDEEKLRDELEATQRRAIRAENSRDSWRADAEHERRSKAAVRGHLTRMKRMIENGVCPAPGCHRHFTNVQRHMASQHPGWSLPEGI